MSRAHYIAGDWGTSRLRLFPCLGALPVVPCGMAGWRNGRREAPCLPCPADLRALGGALALHPRLGTGQRLLCLPGTHAQALRRRGIPASFLDGERCALAGLRTPWQP